jgi:toxin ParE1/3/4
MARLLRSPQAKRDITEVLQYTKERWGNAQARAYGELIKEALVAIANDPERGRARDDVRPGIVALHINQRGRPARHILFYRIGTTGRVEILRLVHDAMDVELHLP